ncbi:UTP--glucose-1-phosphate uridylyltransferase-like isoform X2 [Mangifera indica]|uniref:UTP--glucose-1-phosphate uridylyltransferase-like isoform X2 n=1 Tax=Mangifera indica TaxID=29780 RepID=UPI001CFA90EC|nr:UTP--glucose-1-phosphate uridylyltransferase-like isoform X2 [Mangifera indica]
MTLHSIIIQKLLSTNAHLGRRVAAHHFKQFTYGIRNGMAIIDSDKTLICLRNACHFISLLAQRQATFMFVNTNPLFDEIILQMTKKIGCYNPNMNALWRMGGFLTNSSSPKKFRSRNKKIRFGPTKLPDCVVVLDTDKKSSVIMEAAKLQVPIVGLVDSSMPWEIYSKITYPIPGNDSVQFVYLLCNMITKTFLVEQKKLGLLNDDGEKIDGKKGDGGKVGQIKNNNKKSEIDSLRDEVLVVPYDSLAPISEDTVEAKMFLDKLVVVKFNGVVGTNMGFTGPKSAIEFHNNLTFMDLMVNQIESLNSKFGCNVPLVLMDTTETHGDTQKVVEKYSASKIDIHSFRQKALEGQSGKDKLHPSDHGAVFLSLMKSGTLDVLLSQGKEYALVVHADNVAAVVDPKILNHLIQNEIEYCMEVTPTTSIDLKNSIINSRQGKFQLMNITQNPAKHSDGRFKFIDTRNLWVNLKAIKRLVDTDALKMESLSASKEEYSDQIKLQDTAADSAIRFFDRTSGINVPPSRFLPLNSTSDLLLLKSDLYSSMDGVLVRNNARNNPSNPSIELGPEFKEVSDFLSRFKSIPSIIDLDSLKVTGDVWFGAGITLKGRVNIVAKPGMKLEIPDGAVLENKVINEVADI